MYTELLEVANMLPDPLDRYWLAVYVLVAEPGNQRPNWRVIPFAGLLQPGFFAHLIPPGSWERVD